MKVYVVNTGYVSDMETRHVFATRELARSFVRDTWLNGNTEIVHTEEGSDQDDADDVTVDLWEFPSDKNGYKKSYAWAEIVVHVVRGSSEIDNLQATNAALATALVKAQSDAARNHERWLKVYCDHAEERERRQRMEEILRANGLLPEKEPTS